MKHLIIKNSKLRFSAIVILILLPVAVGISALMIGRMMVPAGDVLHALQAFFTGDAIDRTLYSVVYNLRLPRTLTAIVVGAGLTCAGATFQSLFSNPLATPDTLGVTSATCVGAILAILFEWNLIEIQLLALAFGLLSVFLTMYFARSKGKTSVIMLVLAGVIIGSLFNAIGSLLKYTADPQNKLPEITYWLMGSFASSTYNKLMLATPLILVGVIIIFLMRWKLNILSLSEAEARSMGVNIARTRFVFIIAATLITASSISMCGQVGWIGLLVPHLSRMVCGSNNRFVIPVSLSLGAVMMVMIDTLSRSVTKLELPISILTAILGAPVFISLLKKTRGSFE